MDGATCLMCGGSPEIFVEHDEIEFFVCKARACHEKLSLELVDKSSAHFMADSKAVKLSIDGKDYFFKNDLRVIKSLPNKIQDILRKNGKESD